MQDARPLMAPQTETIYVALLNEAAEAWRPVVAARRSGGRYEILSRNDDPDDEQWQFPPGSLVRCEERSLPQGRFLVAVEASAPLTPRAVETSAECLACKGLAGNPRISPGPPIHIGEYWQIEHAYPSMLVGWLVICLRRHAAALHELSSAEFAELGHLLEQTVRVLHRATGSAKEYVACYAEQGGFEHVHFHVVPRAADLPEPFRGAGSFGMLAIAADEGADRDAVRTFCESLKRDFAR